MDERLRAAESQLRETRSLLVALQSTSKDAGTGGVNGVSVTVNMGSVGSKPTYFKKTTVSAAWVKTTSRLIATFVGTGAEDASVQGMILSCGNLQNGQFDLYVAAPNGASGTYVVHVLGT